jgi:hypothetical protein
LAVARAGTDTQADVTATQGRLLLPLLLDDSEFYGGVQELVRDVRRTQDGALRLSLANLRPGSRREFVARILQQIGAVVAGLGYLEVARDYEAVLEGPLNSCGRLSEEELWLRLDAQRRRALQIEKLVLAEERRRLRRLGRPDLAAAAFRVSERDVAAGYDIASFEEDGSPRIIEVKSSVGSRIRFVWSGGERTCAGLHKDLYWIYFVPLAHLIRPSRFEIIMLRDPIAMIEAGELVERPYAYEVIETRGALERRGSRGTPSDARDLSAVPARAGGGDLYP